MKGITLLEILIVIVIIAILSAVLTISATSFIENQKYNNTVALVKALDAACHNYKTDFYKFPEDSTNLPDGTPITGSKCLHYMLGRKLPKVQGNVKSSEVGPYMDYQTYHFKNKDDINPNLPQTVVDAWENDVNYDNLENNVPNKESRFDKADAPGQKRVGGIDVWTERGTPEDKSFWIYNQ